MIRLQHQLQPSSWQRRMQKKRKAEIWYEGKRGRPVPAGPAIMNNSRTKKKAIVCGSQFSLSAGIIRTHTSTTTSVVAWRQCDVRAGCIVQLGRCWRQWGQEKHLQSAPIVEITSLSSQICFQRMFFFLNFELIKRLCSSSSRSTFS